MYNAVVLFDILLGSNYGMKYSDSKNANLD